MHKDNFYEAVGMAKNYATKEARVEIDFDTNRWSGRMKNIVCKAIDTGVAQCGYETAWWVEHFLKHHELSTVKIWGWQSDLPTTMLKPDKVEESIAYVSAIYKMQQGRLGFGEERWLDNVAEKGTDIDHIRIPMEFSIKDKEKFIKDYLKPQEEQEALKRAELINLVRSGSLLTISYIIK
jgi:hypothetical protein